MLEPIINRLVATDYDFENTILRFLENNYFPPNNLPLFTALLPKTVKLIFYFVCLGLFFSLIKILHPENRTISLILVSTLIIMGLLLVLIFTGFMQLLYE